MVLRPATDADIDFCFQLHKATFRQNVAEVWGWDEDDQRAIHARNFKPERTQIITADGIDVGRLDVDYRDDEIFIRLIEVLPSHQRRGIASRLIRSLLERATIEGKPVTLNVLTVNQRAYRLYRRLGFTEVGREVDGPAVKIHMVAGLETQ
jgi:ribosomal protein S18 acetylase RimI-like enzyme